MDAAMVKVREFPCYGCQYYEILHTYYLNRFVYTESEIFSEIGMERSTFYRRKKEAIVVFGFSIWGTPFEEFKEFLNTKPASVQMSMF